MSGMLLSIYQRVILRNAFWVLAILLAIVGWLGSYIPTLQLDASADALVLEGDESLAYHLHIVY